MCLKSVRNRMKSATVTLVTLTWHFAALCPLRLMFIRLVRSGVDVFLQRIGLTSQIGELLSLAKHRCGDSAFRSPGFCRSVAFQFCRGTASSSCTPTSARLQPRSRSSLLSARRRLQRGPLAHAFLYFSWTLAWISGSWSQSTVPSCCSAR